PYEDLRAEARRRGRHDREYELLDTGAFDNNRYWIVEVSYAKASPVDLLMSIQITNAGPESATLHVLPTAWFRNTWSCDPGTKRRWRGAPGAAACEFHPPSRGAFGFWAGGGRDAPRPPLVF